MARKSTAAAKPSAKRTSTPGIRVDKTVESSIAANHRPRQPSLRQGPKRKSQPKQPSTIGGLTKEASKLRVERERVSAEVVQAARATGMLPHEWMLAVMRGEQINHFAYDADTQEIVEVIVLPTFADRLECAKAAAPFFATRLVPEKRNPGGGFADPAKQNGVMEVPLEQSMEKWTAVAETSQRLLKREVTK